VEKQPLPDGLRRLVERLERLDRPATIEELRQWLNDVQIDRAALAPFVRFQESCYCRNPVCDSPHFELLCICWKSGQSSLIHDHEGSACGVRVMVGELTETIFDLVHDSSVRSRNVNRYITGSVCSSVDKDIHQITNHQPDGSELITLHIYSPPLVTMNSYSLERPAQAYPAAAR
jgi:cysteine dioxygenase